METGNITIRTSKKIINKINNLAKVMDRSRNWVIEDALNDYIATQEWQVRGIVEALQEVEEGNTIPFEEVFAELDERIKQEMGKRAH